MKLKEKIKTYVERFVIKFDVIAAGIIISVLAGLFFYIAAIYFGFWWGAGLFALLTTPIYHSGLYGNYERYRERLYQKRVADRAENINQ